jgi:hypothetical protein
MCLGNDFISALSVSSNHIFRIAISPADSPTKHSVRDIWQSCAGRWYRPWHRVGGSEEEIIIFIYQNDLKVTITNLSNNNYL